MTHRPRPRVHLLTGGPAWEERRAKGNSTPQLSKKQKAAKRKLSTHMAELKAAVSRRDWPAARAARAAAWNEVNQLADHLTRDERQLLYKYKLLLRAGEEQARRAPRQRDRGRKPASTPNGGPNPAPEYPLVWVRPPEADLIQEQRRITAERTRAEVEKKRQERREKAARKAAAKAKAAGKAEKQPREVQVSTSVRTVSGGLPSLGKHR